MIDIVKQVLTRALAHGIPVMSDAALGMLLRITAALLPQNILEIGTATGYSGLCLLGASGNLSRLYTIEIDEGRAAEARTNFAAAGMSGRVTQLIGDAREIVPLITGSYSLIVLDGPKGQYSAMYPWLRQLLAPGGCLFCDNVLYRGLVDGRQVLRRRRLTMVSSLREFIADVFADSGMTSFLSYAGDGVLLSFNTGGG